MKKTILSLEELNAKDAAFLKRSMAERRARHGPFYSSYFIPAECQAITEFLRLPEPVGQGLPQNEQFAAMNAWIDRRTEELKISGKLSEEFQPAAIERWKASQNPSAPKTRARKIKAGGLDDLKP